MTKLEEYKKITSEMNLADLLTWANNEFGKDGLVLASSFSIEDQVLTHILSSIEPKSRILTLDTGRLFDETYQTMQLSIDKYGIKYEVGFPDASAISKLISERGPNFFKNSIEERKLCCKVRKLDPLKKILITAKCWVCGLRREQSVTREGIDIIEWDTAWGLYKLNPLALWKEDEVWDFIRKNEVPYNPLQNHNFQSVGCFCCTRAITDGEDVRAGRWWWENPEHKECGLHNSPHFKSGK